MHNGRGFVLRTHIHMDMHDISCALRNYLADLHTASISTVEAMPSIDPSSPPIIIPPWQSLTFSVRSIIPVAHHEKEAGGGDILRGRLLSVHPFEFYSAQLNARSQTALHKCSLWLCLTICHAFQLLVPMTSVLTAGKTGNLKGVELILTRSKEARQEIFGGEIEAVQNPQMTN